MHWLTFGAGDLLPVIAGRQPVLMAGSGVEAPVRFGVFTEAMPTAAPVSPASAAGVDGSKGSKGEKDGAKKPEVARAGWSALPEGVELRLRLSGLLWPEAAQRIANSAALTRESLGRGQVILFAGGPCFRGTAQGTTRLLLNAIVFGPGFGTAPTVRP